MVNRKDKLFEDIGERLKEIRKELCLKMKTASEETGISRSYIADFEKGYRMPTSKYMIYLHNKHKVNLNHIFSGEKPMFRKSTAICPPDFGGNQGDINDLLCLMHKYPLIRYLILAHGERLRIKIAS